MMQLWITGTVCVGKSTMSAMIADRFNLALINEETSGGLPGMLEMIPSEPQAVVEHVHLLRVLDTSWPWEETQAVRSILPGMKLGVILLTGSKQLLLKHRQERIDTGVKGDYIRVDPVAMQAQIEAAFHKLFGARGSNSIHLQVAADADYALCMKRALDFAGDFFDAWEDRAH